MMSFQLYCIGYPSAGANAADCYGRWNESHEGRWGISMDFFFHLAVGMR